MFTRGYNIAAQRGRVHNMKEALIVGIIDAINYDLWLFTQSAYLKLKYDQSETRTNINHLIINLLINCNKPRVHVLWVN